MFRELYILYNTSIYLHNSNVSVFFILSLMILKISSVKPVLKLFLGIEIANQFVGLESYEMT